VIHPTCVGGGGDVEEEGAYDHDAAEGEGLAWSTWCAMVILAIGLGLDDGDLGFPPHSISPRPRYDPDLVCTAITTHAIIGPRSSSWETTAASWRSGKGWMVVTCASLPTPSHLAWGTTLIRSASPLQSVQSSDPDRVRGRRWWHPAAQARAGQQWPGGPVLWCNEDLRRRWGF
jgi:hypothetical protein